MEMNIIMKDKLRANEIRTFFVDKPFNSDDLYNFYANEEPDLKKTTFRWRVYALKNNGVISSLMKGVYTTRMKKDFKPVIDKKLINLFRKVKNQFPYTEMAIWETSWLNNYMVHQAFSSNIIIEVEKDGALAVFAFLQELYSNVYLNPGKVEIENYIRSRQNNIIIKNLTMTSPLTETDAITVPRVEKIIVDIFTDEVLFDTYQGAELQNIFREFFSNFNINQSTLRQYASKRHVSDRLISFLQNETNIDKKELLM